MSFGPLGIKPRAGFNWQQVSWGGPDEPVALVCSYCDAPLPDGDGEDFTIPLRLWNVDGWGAAFCPACMVLWWGFSPLEQDDGQENA